ncbi:putative major facilitator superfamily transporter [Caenibius tardaugens NBRC 16725]|uniref:Putative major facilitator superfamily transporter n=1 Tax=Caenibius tardaugens NBRC 16725 TaxID=1219035 RepID=U2ZW43_9SPHN|nr:MFS transporter [Caenibius tardaugens]AZI37826.1 MFS transporter [Caenibius tardaugens NBRC 16725]GAD49599.1 putative major facilitator superfamily transporter [Caenibius tardaugens NBRC 16725]
MKEPNSPLQIPDYRLFWLARFLAVFSTLSMVVLIGYQTYDIARSDYGMDKAQAALQLGFLGLVQFIPLFLLAPVAGWAADRFERRKVAICANLLDSFSAIALALLTLFDALNLPILFTIAAAHGAARIFTGPALTAIAPNIVPPRLLPQAIALSSMAWQAATVIGPAVGGLLFGLSESLPYFLSFALLLGSALLTYCIKPVYPPADGANLHPLKLMAEGFTFTVKQRFLLGCVTLDLFAVLLGGATALLPVYARDILKVGAEGLGIMRGAPALGAALVALWLSFRPVEYNVGTKMLWAVVIFGAATIGFGYSTNLGLSLVMLFILGAADMVSVFIRSTLVQLHTPDSMRGRVSSISGLAVSASNELGEMRAGVFAAALGSVGAVVIGGAGAIIVTALWAWLFPEIRRAKTFDTQYHDHDKGRVT